MPYVRGALNIPPTLPWVLSTIIIIDIALYEEIVMRRLHSEYNKYMLNTSFMLPFPKRLRKYMPRINSSGDIILSTIIVVTIIMISSYTIYQFKII